MGLNNYKLEEQIEKSLRESEGDFPMASQRLPKDFPITATRTFELIKLSTLSREIAWSHNTLIMSQCKKNNLNISGYGIE